MKPLCLVLGAAVLLAALRADAQAPAILSQPQSATNNVASAADFSVVASNAVTYQWFFQGTNTLAGATSASLSLDDLSTNQAGSYTVVVTSSNNISVTSAPPAVLTVVQGTIIQWTISKYSGGGGSNFLVALFDHDKPATVENFIHYITSGAYSNMFFDRDVTNFVLQGGDYASQDRTTNGFNINALSPGTNFPSQIDNEFGVGPLIHNSPGTLAMALQSGETNSADTAFFFNLVDNSASLDSQDFTVFGRILTNSGSNVLQYFNTLSAPSNGIYDYSSFFSYNIPTLPVNYNGTNAPTDANLFYCDFAFETPPPVITNPPVAAITFPTTNETFTNITQLTFTGTAADSSGGLAQVYCAIDVLTGDLAGQGLTNAAVGTTNWSLFVQGFEPGVYEVTAYAQDGAGILSAPATSYFTNFAVLTIITNSDGELSTNLQYLVPGQQYSLTAQPGPGQEFVNWQIDGVTSLNPVQTFTADTNMTAEVTYFTTNLPSGLAITNPAAGSVVPTVLGALTIGGTLPSSVTVTQLLVQLFSQSNAVTAPLPGVINGANWSLAVSNLTGGLYTVQVSAWDSLGQEGVVSESFTALVPPIIVSQSSNLTVNTGASADFNVVANNAISYQWSFQGTSLAGATDGILALNDVSSNQAGSYTVVITAPDGEMVTSAPVVLTVVQGTIIQWTISNYADGGSSNFLVELFDHDKPATVANFIHYITSGAYSNTFFDTLVSSALEGGNYVTADRMADDTNIYDVSTGTNIFPSQIDSEFGLGALIPNTYGTLAALGSANPADGPSAFFFNLADNSTNFDEYGYTVFGRIISGSNVLQYFNTLSAPSNGIYTNFSVAPDLPVNYHGTNAPTDANLFYCDFSFQTKPPVFTNRPAVSIAVPSSNAAYTNGFSLTVQGTAQDAAALAEVFCVLSSTNGLSNFQNQTNTAEGTTNWSLDLGSLQPGIYQLTAYAQDGAGNLSAPATQYFTNLAILTITTNVNGQLTNSAPQYVVPGTTSSVTAAPPAGQFFDNWNINGVTSLEPTQTFTVNGNLSPTVTYFSQSSSQTVTITNPNSSSNALSIQYLLTIGGSLASTNITQLTCQFFRSSNSISGSMPANVSGTNWFLTVTNYPNGSNYTVQALAADATGQYSLASANFTLVNVEILTLKTNGGGTIVNTNPVPYIAPGNYSVKAVPAKGYVFYSWNNGVTTTLNPIKTFQIVSNLTLTATFVPQDTSLTGFALTYPLANALLTNATFNVAGTVPASLSVTQLTCQLFFQSNGVTTSPQPVTLDATSKKWTFPVSNLTAGAYSILAVGYDDHGNARLVSENFNLLARLLVNVQGKGTVTAGLNGKYLQVGKSYSIAATPQKGQLFEYWTGPVASPNSAKTTFVMSNDAVLTATFASNLFPNVAGAYTGLFLDPSGVSPSNSGFLKITVTSTGSFSGDLMFPSITYPIYYTFLYDGLAVLPPAPDAFNSSNQLDLVLGLDLTNGTGTITGYITELAPSGIYNWASDVVLYKAVTALSGSNAPAAGKYPFLMQPENAADSPPASGYASASLASSGALTLSGVLPDDTAISQSAKVSKDGIWPVYLVLSKNKSKGMVLGWQTNTSSGLCAGQLFWCQPGIEVASNLISTGAAFMPPAANSQYQMILPGGTTNALPVSSSGKFVAESPIESISLQSTGILTGTIKVNNAKLSFKGAFINPTQGGAGFIIDANGQTEGFSILRSTN